MNTPYLRGEVMPSGTGSVVLVSPALHRLVVIGLIVQIILTVFLTIVGLLAAIANPVFFVFAAFVDTAFLVRTIPAYFEMRRDWAQLSGFLERTLRPIESSGP